MCDDIKWIPVTERLPEINKEECDCISDRVLITYLYDRPGEEPERRVITGYYYNGAGVPQWVTDNYEQFVVGSRHVLAWAEIKPYMGEVHFE